MSSSFMEEKLENSSPALNKAKTMRKRRLSLSKLGNYSSDESPPPNIQVDLPLSLEIDGEKAHTFRKRRLSLGSHTSREESKNEKRRRLSLESATSANSNNTEHWPARTLHANELFANNKDNNNNNAANENSDDDNENNTSVFYRQQHLVLQRTEDPLLPNQQDDAVTAKTFVLSRNQSQKFDKDVATTNDNNAGPKWKTRKLFDNNVADDHPDLPFPRHIVGTYSCHGVEPIYQEDDDDDEVSSDIDNDNGLTVSAPIMVAKTNQDRGGVVFPYGNSPKTALFAVYDGHGNLGELVSQFALYEVQRRLEKHAGFKSKPQNIKQAFIDTFLAVDKALGEEPTIEPLFAGTTACVVLLQDNILTTANVGDSRAVLARKDPDFKGDGVLYNAVDLTKDQNPDLPEEAARIHAQGGYVSPSPGPGLSARVWLDPGRTQIGLAMARSLGDHAVATVGVIAEPVVKEYTLTNSDSDDFMIIASDGVWEFITSQMAVDIVAQHLEEKGATKACQALIEAAAERWHEEEGEYRDDITAIVVKLRELW